MLGFQLSKLISFSG